MPYLDNLPAQCPPNDAIDQPLVGVWRVVGNNPPAAADFWSHARLGWKKPPTVSDCDFSSCSLFLSRDKVAKLASRLPKARISNPRLAKLNVPVGAGRSQVNRKTEHVHFWMYGTFDPVAAVKACEDL